MTSITKLQIHLCSNFGKTAFVVFRWPMVDGHNNATIFVVDGHNGWDTFKDTTSSLSPHLHTWGWDYLLLAVRQISINHCFYDGGGGGCSGAVAKVKLKKTTTLLVLLLELSVVVSVVVVVIVLLVVMETRLAAHFDNSITKTNCKWVMVMMMMGEGDKNQVKRTFLAKWR